MRDLLMFAAGPWLGWLLLQDAQPVVYLDRGFGEAMARVFTAHLRVDPEPSPEPAEAAEVGE